MVISTQQSIPIAGVKDGIIILKNGSYRMVLEVSAINFSLKSDQEQSSLIFQYQSFLNSLHFPVEVLIRSKRLDLNPYLNKIRQASEKSVNELIRAQISDYIDFVTKLISLANIMKKSFYLVVPYDPVNIKKLNIFDSLFTKAQRFDHLKIADTEFKASVDQLKQRANIVASGLGSMGLHCFQLSTEEIVELFYQIYNPDESGKERVEDVAALSSPVVAAKEEIKDADNIQRPEEGNFERSIDNVEMVQEQQKIAAQQSRQATAKEDQAEAKPAQAAPEAKPTAAPQATAPNPNQAQIQDNAGAEENMTAQPNTTGQADGQ